GAGIRDEGGRRVPEARGVGGYVLQVEEQVRRPVGVRGQTAQESRTGEQRAQENGRGVVAGQPRPEGGALKGVLKPRQRPTAVQAMRAVGLSERRACTLAGQSRTTQRYRARPKEEARLRRRLRELAARWTRYGTPRLTMLMRKEFGAVNHKRIERLYREEGLRLP